ncbi:MAG: glycoside hydrolase family 2 protein [Clostridia bacterium]|nr:glycoside hydrolase family 2 protein [Clostridia bacterium]
MRNIFNINETWYFSKEAACAPSALPADWEAVQLPHTWNATDGQDGGADYHRGTCWYAKKLKKSDFPEAERYYIEICGANSSADLFMDGQKLAHHDGGYSTWRVDITEAFGDETLLAISVDNAPNDRVYPQMADFTFYGGLYRDINLICVSHSHFDLDYFGSPGIMVTPTVCGDSAEVEIRSFITNPAPGQTVRFTVFDMDGAPVTEAEGPGAAAILKIPAVHLWQGRRDPYLYTAQAELLADGAMIDRVSARFGCRTFSVDLARGFILNGEEYSLRGVSRHQDRLGIGNALLPEHHREDMDLICEMGANTIRLAHYQHDQYFYDLCDKKGMVVWAEIPYISRHMPGGRENTVTQLTELIAQNYNHPSIVVWGLSNEITMQGADDPDLIENHRILNDLAHEMDKTRPTAIACISMCDPDAEYLKIPDLISYNHYFGWYGGNTDMNGPWFDAFHEKHPRIPIGCSEYGCEALNWHTSDPQQGDYTEEYQAFYHEELIKQLFSRKYLWATHVWNMFDFGADARCEGGEDGRNHKGLVTFDRGYKKDAFYAYKAWLSDEPFVHICGKRYVDRVEDVTRITVYSNQPAVELLVNGEPLEQKCSETHFFYFNVPNKGETWLTAVAGNLRDESFIRKADVFNEDYRLKDKNAVLNWFDITEREGHFSLKDKISDIARNPAALKILLDTVSGNEESGINLAGTEMLSFIGEFTFLRLTSLLGTLHIHLHREDLLEINRKLNEIKK